jgi:hypothetical protein
VTKTGKATVTAFYEQVNADRFLSTELTRGPWDAGAQHGGPPTALAGHIVEYLFVNPDLTVVLHRYPAGEWVAMEARTTLGGAGIGVAESTLHDERGPIGHGLQSLFVAARP